MSVWKSDETLLSICILNFSFKNDFVWEEISNIRHSVSSPDETPRSSSKILCCASYFQLSSRCFIWWWNTASHVWYITSNMFKDIVSLAVIVRILAITLLRHLVFSCVRPHSEHFIIFLSLSMTFEWHLLQLRYDWTKLIPSGGNRTCTCWMLSGISSCRVIFSLVASVTLLYLVNVK